MQYNVDNWIAWLEHAQAAHLEEELKEELTSIELLYRLSIGTKWSFPDMFSRTDLLHVNVKLHFTETNW